MTAEPWAWWHSIGSPGTVCAPMVDQSERAFRLLVRRHGCALCYTPMLHADLVVRDAAFLRDRVPDDVCGEDRPLVAQLGGSDPAVLGEAARKIAAKGGCDAIDVNLGCPQACARRGGYGAFLSDDQAVQAVRAVAAGSNLPVTAKIRCRAAGDPEGLAPDVAATVALARKLVAAGASVICVHARTRAGKTFTEACWPAVKAVVAAVGVPVVANGGVRHFEDVERLRRATGCAAVMSAEALLADPWLFSPAPRPDAAAACRAYLALAAAAPVSWARAHVVAMLHAELARDAGLVEAVAAARTVPELLAAVPRDAGPLHARDRAAEDAPPYAALLKRGRAERRQAKDAAMRAAAPEPRRRAPRPPSERQKTAVATTNLRLCACGEPAKHACVRECCQVCCAAANGGVDCGNHASRKKKRKVALTTDALAAHVERVGTISVHDALRIGHEARGV